MDEMAVRMAEFANCIGQLETVIDRAHCKVGCRAQRAQVQTLANNSTSQSQSRTEETILENAPKDSPAPVQ